MKTCCFTGHRIIKNSPELSHKLKSTIVNAIENGVIDFYDGGAIGFDMLCAEEIMELKPRYSSVKLHMLLPCPPDEQTTGWRSEQIDRYKRILSAADSITILSEHYYRGCMKRRNKSLVEIADCCICYCSNLKSGTGQTVGMAIRKGISITNLYTQV